jgi:hypothetical protein
MLPIHLEDIQKLIEQNKNLIVKIGNTYEISRPLALKLWSVLIGKVVSAGGSIKEHMRVEHVSPEMVIVSVSCTIIINESEITLCEVGEAHKSEGKEDTLARTAYTRAMKRLLEKAIGEDSINQMIKKLFPDAGEIPATERQKELIIKLVKEEKITKRMVEEVLGEGASLNQALKENTLTQSQASALIDRARRR